MQETMSVFEQPNVMILYLGAISAMNVAGAVEVGAMFDISEGTVLRANEGGVRHSSRYRIKFFSFEI
jgi:hypothetical protein